jgi:hypothetical protein
MSRRVQSAWMNDDGFDLIDELLGERAAVRAPTPGPRRSFEEMLADLEKEPPPFRQRYRGSLKFMKSIFEPKRLPKPRGRPPGRFAERDEAIARYVAEMMSGMKLDAALEEAAAKFGVRAGTCKAAYLRSKRR